MSQPSNLNADQTPAATAPPRWQFSVRGLLTLTAAVAIYLAAFAALFRDVDTSRQWQLASLLLGVFCISIPFVMALIFIGARRRAGLVYTRLTKRQSCLSWFVETCWLPLLAIVVFYVARESLAVHMPLYHWPREDRWPMAIRMGIAGGMMFCLWNGIWTIACPSLDLSEHGIVHHRLVLIPWSNGWTNRRTAYRISDHNILTLGRGWLRTEAFVPPEQRESVEALLKVKLGEQFQTKN